MRRFVSFFLTVILAWPSLSPAVEGHGAALPSFPGAEGFGATTPGGRGGRVIEVTTLADDGPGSLRQAVRQTGPRIIVFRVGGLLQLHKDISVSEPYLTIAGQTAPGGGLCLAGAGLRIATHDVIVRHLRVRVGDDPAGPDPENRDGIGVANNKTAPCRVIIDHCSVSWAIDENMQLWYPCHDITIQWCLIAESLEKSLHPKGAHGMGLLVGDHARRVSVHHNLFAHNMDRNPLLKGDTVTEVINNVVYNWRNHGTALTDPEGSGPQLAHLIGNVYLPGPQSAPRPGITLQASVKPGTSVLLRGNIGPGRPQDAGDEWAAALNRSDIRARLEAPVLAGERVRIDKPSEMRDLLLTAAGATRPERDAVDARIVQTIRDGAGRLINSPGDVGGWPAYRNATPPTDSDHDGMPDDWELARGLNPRDPADGPRCGPEGYTWIEVYLAELAR